MVSSRVYHAKNPICAKSADDPRIIRLRTLDGRTMTKQQLRLEELSAQGREWKKNPELKPKPKPEGHAMAWAMAHLDELLENSKKKQDSKQAAQEESEEMQEQVSTTEVDGPDACLPAESFTETTTWQKMINTLQSWMQKASPYVITLGSTVVVLLKYLVLSLGIMLEVFRLTLEEMMRKYRDSTKVKNSSELAKHGVSDCKENITEAAADSSATDEIEVQGEVLPSNCVTHQDGCDSLEQSSGAAERDDIEVQGAGAASDSERQRHLDEQIVLSFINPVGRLPLATVWLMFPWSFGLWGQMKGSTISSVVRASMVIPGLTYKLCKPMCQQSSSQLVLNRQSQCDQWILLLWSSGGGKTMPSTSMVWPLLKRFQCKTLLSPFGCGVWAEYSQVAIAHTRFGLDGSLQEAGMASCEVLLRTWPRECS
eukprot:symbB.v1.2.025919.t1/scaffold2551.1/size76478/5